MEETNNKITVYVGDKLVETYEGNYFLYRDDYKKEGCIHFKDANGKHHRIYGGTVIVDEI